MLSRASLIVHTLPDKFLMKSRSNPSLSFRLLGFERLAFFFLLLSSTSSPSFLTVRINIENSQGGANECVFAFSPPLSALSQSEGSFQGLEESI